MVAEPLRNGSFADLVLRNGTVWAVDGHRPRAEAVAIKGNEIVVVGRNEEVAPLIGKGTRVHDLQGRLVLPGFNDSHTHLLLETIVASTAFSLYQVDSLEKVQRRLGANARAHPDSEWLYGSRWSNHLFDGVWPTRSVLDMVEDQRPVAIFDIDWHTAWVNTVALERLGYDASTRDPEGGTIVRDGSGMPTGILFENAHAAIPSIPRPADEVYAHWLAKEAEGLNRLGITSISNMESRVDNVELTACLAGAGRLNLRINHWPELPKGLAHARQAQALCRGSEQVRVVGLKAFMDGVLSNRTAWLLEPYSDAAEICGYPVSDVEELAQNVLAADAAGFQVVIHAIGDRAVRETLDLYERAGKANGRRDSRHRIEHAELIHPADVSRFAALGVIPSMTPVHLCAPSVEKYLLSSIGLYRGESAYAWRSLVDAGANLCFGTDWSALELERPNPLEQIFAAVTRIPPQEPGEEPLLHPEQCLTVEQAIRSYTLESARAEFMEQRKGSITPGKLADLCVLSKNILDADPGQILETEVVMTVFDGRVVCERL
jgi:predicted amidohydrolase YtcJ